MYFINDQTAQAISRTLLHSIWQGLLLSLGSALVILLTRRSTAALRYNLLAGLFLLFLLSVGITFSVEYETSFPDSGWSAGPQAVLASPQAAVPLDMVIQQGPFLQGQIQWLTDICNRHAYLIVMIWLLILGVHSFRLLASALYIHRLRNHRIQAPSGHWKQKIRDLAQRLHITREVNLFSSGLVKVPMMVGIIKPVILFPASLLSQLPAAQVEAVLLHELAHVRRQDYVVNLLQNLAEIIFFFNPGLLWVSSLIREERENCCDDIAIGQSGNKKDFIEALVSFQQYHLAAPSMAIAFPGKKNHLLNRVHRIITSHNKTLNNMEKISIAAGVLTICLLTLAFRQTSGIPEVKAPQGQTPKSPATLTRDTLPEEASSRAQAPQTIRGLINGKQYEAILQDHNLTALWVNGKNIPEKKWGSHVRAISTLLASSYEDQSQRLAQKIDMEMAQTDLAHQEEALNHEMEAFKLQQEAMADSRQADQLRKKEDEWMQERQKMERQQLADLDQGTPTDRLRLEMESHLLAIKELQKAIEVQSRSLNDKDLKNRLLALQKKQAELTALQGSLMHAKMSQDQMSRAELLKIKAEMAEMGRLADMDARRADDFRVGHPIPPQVVVSPGYPFPATPSADIDAVIPPPPAPLIEQSKPIADIIGDLKAEHIISNGEDLSFTLNNDKLEVNGIVQPAAIFSRLKSKYIKGSKDHVIYSSHNGSTSADVYVNNDK